MRTGAGTSCVSRSCVVILKQEPTKLWATHVSHTEKSPELLLSGLDATGLFWMQVAKALWLAMSLSLPQVHPLCHVQVFGRGMVSGVRLLEITSQHNNLANRHDIWCQEEANLFQDKAGFSCLRSHWHPHAHKGHVLCKALSCDQEGRGCQPAGPHTSQAPSSGVTTVFCTCHLAPSGSWRWSNSLCIWPGV